MKYLFNCQQPTEKIARWKALISSYNYETEHIKGTHNPADFLSRRAYPEDNPAHFLSKRAYPEDLDSDVSNSFKCATHATRPRHISCEKLCRDKAAKIPMLTATWRELAEKQSPD